jgi:hypothetical protein
MKVWRPRIVVAMRHFLLLCELIAVAVLLSITSSAKAGAPFFTEDPDIIFTPWEISSGVIYEKRDDQRTIGFPLLDLNYRVHSCLQINLTLGMASVEAESNHTGLADAGFKAKYRMIEEREEEWIPSISVAPNITIPAADHDLIGDGLWRLALPLQLGKSFGRFSVYGEFGYQWVLDDSATDQIHFGLVLQYQLTQKLSAGAELTGNMTLASSREETVIGNIGFAYAISEQLQILGSAGRTVGCNDEDGPVFVSQFYLQMNF